MISISEVVERCERNGTIITNKLLLERSADLGFSLNQLYCLLRRRGGVAAYVSIGPPKRWISSGP